MSDCNPPAAADVLGRLEAAGVAAAVKLRLEPKADATLPPELVAEAKQARLGLLRLLVLGEHCGPLPPIPSGDLPPLFAVLEATGVRLWAPGGGPADGAGERLLVALRAAWPVAVMHPLVSRWAARVEEAGEAAGFRRLFADAVDVTRADLAEPRWRPPAPGAGEAAEAGKPPRHPNRQAAPPLLA